MSNLLTLRSQVRFKANIDDTSDLTDTEIDQLLNDAQGIIASRLVRINEDFFEEQKAKFNLSANSALYQLPTTLLKFKQLRINYANPVTESDYVVASGYNPTDISNVGFQEENISQSSPIVDITGNYMRIKPTPVVDSNKGGEIYFIRRPTSLALSGDISEIPAEYHDLLSTYGAGKACEKFEVWAKADRFDQQFYRGMDNMIKELSGRELDYPLRFKSPYESGRFPIRETY